MIKRGFKIKPIEKQEYSAILNGFLKNEEYPLDFLYLFDEETLAKPLSSMSSFIAKTPIGYKTYSTIGHRKAEDFVEEVMGIAKDDISSRYSAKGIPMNFMAKGNTLNYKISTKFFLNFEEKLEGETEIFPIGPPQKPTTSSLKKEIPFVYDIMESVVNATYEKTGSDIELDCIPEYPEHIGYIKDTVKNKKIISQSTPKVTFNDIGGCEKAKEELRRFAFYIKNPDITKEWGVAPQKGVLLYGPPGTGKTLLAKATANEIDANFDYVRISEVESKWVGESEKNMTEIFRKAGANKPSIIFFDELDALGAKRDEVSHYSSKLVNVMLSEMDGLEDMEGVMVLGATNMIESVDHALLRPGRFDSKIEVPLPDRKAIEQIYRIKANARKVDENIDIGNLSDRSNGFSGADIEAIVNEAAKIKVDDVMRGGKPLPISTEDIIKCINDYKKSHDSLGSSTAVHPHMYH
jgi:AAA+ superfamily predicted ATPase